LLDVGQASGELDQLLVRIAERYSRQARRLIDRLAALLEPAVILILAALVGTVVMAAVLPLLRLQEIL
jgi:type IV pilus assembly protein PilC